MTMTWDDAFLDSLRSQGNPSLCDRLPAAPPRGPWGGLKEQPACRARPVSPGAFRSAGVARRELH